MRYKTTGQDAGYILDYLETTKAVLGRDERSLVMAVMVEVMLKLHNKSYLNNRVTLGLSPPQAIALHRFLLMAELPANDYTRNLVRNLLEQLNKHLTNTLKNTDHDNTNNSEFGRFIS